MFSKEKSVDSYQNVPLFRIAPPIWNFGSLFVNDFLFVLFVTVSDKNC